MTMDGPFYEIYLRTKNISDSPRFTNQFYMRKSNISDKYFVITLLYCVCIDVCRMLMFHWPV